MALETTIPTSANGVIKTHLSTLDVLTLAQVANYLQLPEDVVRVEAESGGLIGQRIGGEWRFLREIIVQWLKTPRQTMRPNIMDFPVSDETPEEYEAFMERIRAHRDEVDRATGSGKYATE